MPGKKLKPLTEEDKRQIQEQIAAVRNRAVSPVKRGRPKKKTNETPKSISTTDSADTSTRKTKKRKLKRTQDQTKPLLPPEKDDGSSKKPQKRTEHRDTGWVIKNRILRAHAQDIAPLETSSINWERRNACQHDLKRFLKTYFPNVYNLEWGLDHARCIEKAETVCTRGGTFALAMPRGGGKTAICRGTIIWATLYGYCTFPFLIGSTSSKAIQSLDAIKTAYFSNTLLHEDFPEVTHPVINIKNSSRRAGAQSYLGEQTRIIWQKEQIRYACLQLAEEEITEYVENMEIPKALLKDTSFPPEKLNGYRNFSKELRKSNSQAKEILAERRRLLIREATEWEREDCPIIKTDSGRYMLKSGGTTINVAGIDGSIRGEAEMHPILLSQPRPDLVLLDDLQKDQKADSLVSRQRLIDLIDGAIQGLYGPTDTPTALMPCTVICEGDVADTFLDHDIKPEWRGEKCKMVVNWPEGITDLTIDPDTPAGSLWLEYDEKRKHDLRTKGHIDHVTEWFLQPENYQPMMEGFQVSWEARKDKNSYNAQQNAMNLRFTIPDKFPAEYQNNPKTKSELVLGVPSPKEFAQKTIGFPEFQIPYETQHLVCMVDVQHELLFYTVLAVSQNFSGVFTTYGTFPQIKSNYFRKADVHNWRQLTRMFFSEYPEQAKKAKKDRTGKPMAPLDAKIWHALSLLVPKLQSMVFWKNDSPTSQSHPEILNKALIDPKGAAEELLTLKEQSGNSSDIPLALKVKSPGNTPDLSVTQRRIPMKISHIGIDCREGKLSETIKQFCTRSGLQEKTKLVPYQGMKYAPTARQLDELARSDKNALFEDQRHPLSRNTKWVWRPDQSGQYALTVDSDRMKTFLMARLIAPQGSPGSICLYDAPPRQHQLFCDHVCDSEFPTAVEAKGIIKELWENTAKKSDNDFLDTSAGCCALASFTGAFIEADTTVQYKRGTVGQLITDRWRKQK